MCMERISWEGGKQKRKEMVEDGEHIKRGRCKRNRHGAGTVGRQQRSGLANWRDTLNDE